MQSGQYIRQIAPSSAALLGLMLSGCMVTQRNDYAHHELMGLAPAQIIPKTAPVQFIRGFKAFCLLAEDTRVDALAAAGYVENKMSRNNLRSFVSADSRPAVIIQERDGLSVCAVLAQSRAGQTQAVADFIAQIFPQARAAVPSLSGAEAAFVVQRYPPVLLQTHRNGAPDRDSTYILSISYPTGADVAPVIHRH